MNPLENNQIYFSCRLMLLIYPFLVIPLTLCWTRAQLIPSWKWRIRLSVSIQQRRSCWELSMSSDHLVFMFRLQTRIPSWGWHCWRTFCLYIRLIAIGYLTRYSARPGISKSTLCILSLDVHMNERLLKLHYIGMFEARERTTEKWSLCTCENASKVVLCLYNINQ